MRFIFRILAVLLITHSVQGQPLTILSQKTIGCSGNDGFSSFFIDDDGHYVAAGRTTVPNCAMIGTGIGKTDGWVTKLDTSGNKIWSTLVGGPQDEWFTKIIPTQDDGYLAVGSSLSNPNATNGSDYDYLVAKLDHSGAVLWSKFYGGEYIDQASDVVETSDGGFIVIGITGSQGGDVTDFKGGPCDAWIIKIDHTGNLLWQKAYGSSQADNAYSIIRTTNNNFMVIGRAGTADSNVASVHIRDDVWLINLDNQGNILWSKTYGGSSWDVGRSILQTRDGGYLLGCTSSSSDGDVGKNYGDEDLWAVKIDATGIIQWEHNYGGSLAESRFSSIIESKEGGYLFLGTSASKDFDALGNHGAYGDVLAVKTTATGAVEWSQMYGGSSGESAPTTYQLADSSYLFGTTTQSSDGDVVGSHGSGEGWLVNLGNPRKTPGVAVPYLPGNSAIEIFPIPCSEVLNIRGLNNEDKVIDILDCSGKMIEAPTQRYSNRIALDMSRLPEGFYFLRVMQHGTVYHFKILHN